jgi:hypothetical protein
VSSGRNLSQLKAPKLAQLQRETDQIASLCQKVADKIATYEAINADAERTDLQKYDARKLTRDTIWAAVNEMVDVVERLAEITIWIDSGSAAQTFVARARNVESRMAGDVLSERLRIPDAVLSSTDLRKLGYTRRLIDQIWRVCPTEVWEGSRRPLVRVRDFIAWRERYTYREGDGKIR